MNEIPFFLPSGPVIRFFLYEVLCFKG